MLLSCEENEPFSDVQEDNPLVGLLMPEDSAPKCSIVFDFDDFSRVQSKSFTLGCLSC